MNKFELFSVQQHLSDWPYALTFEELINAMENENEETGDTIFLWQPFEDLPLPDVARMIKSMAKNLKLVFMSC